MGERGPSGDRLRMHGLDGEPGGYRSAGAMPRRLSVPFELGDAGSCGSVTHVLASPMPSCECPNTYSYEKSGTRISNWLLSEDGVLEQFGACDRTEGNGFRCGLDERSWGPDFSPFDICISSSKSRFSTDI
mmetsp:Transcript_20118/g.55779  ORF Transcript_20118/g.55779 Transcript_20118/m.55779 type:complete len:131 (-) Transcript_20118:289-681(-)